MIYIKKIRLIILFILGLILFILFCPLKINKNSVNGYEPIKNDVLANEFKPVIISNNEFSIPYKILYRSAIDDENNTYIAYHIFWDREINLTNGIMPFLSRNIYTGGLKIQKLMYGKEDVEVIEIKLNPDKEVIRVQYETAENYNPNNFGVEHKNVVVEETDLETYENRVFEVISWNHLFDLKKIHDLEMNDKETVDIEVEYFNNEEWEEYEMSKKITTILKKDRAHYGYEREFID